MEVVVGDNISYLGQTLYDTCKVLHANLIHAFKSCGLNDTMPLAFNIA